MFPNEVLIIFQNGPLVMAKLIKINWNRKAKRRKGRKNEFNKLVFETVLQLSLGWDILWTGRISGFDRMLFWESGKSF